MPGPYEGVHGFVFLYQDDPADPSDVIDSLLELRDPYQGPVFFAALFEGDFAGFVHFAAGDLEGLVDFTGSRLFDAGVRSDYAVEGAVHRDATGPRGPKRKSPRFCGICRVHTSDTPRSVLRAIASAFDGGRPLVGASRVIGGFQLLVELGADDPDELDRAIESLRSVPGVETVEVGTTDTGQRVDPGEGG
jgi:hypothetical protein